MLRRLRLRKALNLNHRPNLAISRTFGTAEDKKGSNIAQGDTVRPSNSKEVANATKGEELTEADNLKYVTIEHGAQAFEGDLRSTSGLGLGDGLYTHTAKWNEVRTLPSPKSTYPGKYKISCQCLVPFISLPLLLNLALRRTKPNRPCNISENRDQSRSMALWWPPMDVSVTLTRMPHNLHHETLLTGSL